MIPRRTFLQLAAPAVLTSQTKARPNVLFILTDQQHIDSISAGGCAYTRTPAMDSLQHNGVSFAQSYCPDPVCSPSRSAIFSGRMASETGVTSNGRPIRDPIPNLGQWFSANSNYETIYSGKWHVPRTYTSSIPGFKVLPGGISGQGNMGDSCVSRSCEAWLRNRTSSKPFLMVASFLQPHDICEWLRINMQNRDESPFRELQDKLPPLPANFEFDSKEPEHLRRTRQKCEPAKGGWSRQHWRYYMWSYYRHVEMVDGEVGRILQALRETGRERDTLVVFSADHGEGLAHHQMVRKSISYDEATRVPRVAWRAPRNSNT
jgi:arylsulfatase A-like enzyme